MKLKTTQVKLTLYISIFFVLLYNVTFFKKVLSVYNLTLINILFITSLSIVLVCVINILINIYRSKIYFKPLIVILFLVSSILSYVMDNFGVVVDQTMLLNVESSDYQEMLDLFHVRPILYFLLLGVLPSVLIYKIQILHNSAKVEFSSRIKSIGSSLIIAILLIFSFSKFYASFFREHKPIRYYTNPTHFIFAAGKYVSSLLMNPITSIAKVGTDAVIPTDDVDRELIILVVGETARSDRFSLNGYSKETNPLLKKEEIVSFPNVLSCGTSTAVSVPCMFSKFGRDNYSDEKAKSHENLLDILTHTKEVNVLWRDNNSDSKGVAVRGHYEDYKSPTLNTSCDVECRDEGMLVGLKEYIKSKPTGDIFIVLHQMGNHGPAYYKRYPKEFEKFKPTCQTNALEKCTNEEIGNTYDNAILYTDYFLTQVIKLLKEHSNKFETAMVYVSDHGESLGENGIYLHGLPYFMAPIEQIKVPLIMWFGGELREDMDFNLLKQRKSNNYSHDNIFHTMLGLMEVEVSEYNEKLDILHGVSEHSE